MRVDQQGNAPQKRRATEHETGDCPLEQCKTPSERPSGGSSRKLSKTFASFPRGWTTWKLKTEHKGILQQLQEANREVRAGLERLEKNPGPTSAPGSTVAPSGEGRKPALVIGGWDADQDAKTTREEATKARGGSICSPLPRRPLTKSSPHSRRRSAEPPVMTTRFTPRLGGKPAKHCG